MALRAVVDLEHQRAACVEDLQVALFGIGVDVFGDPVGGEYDDRAFGNLVDLVHEYDALFPEGVDDKLVVHDFMAHIDGGAEFFEGLLDYVDGTVNAGTEPAGGGKYNLFHFVVPSWNPGRLLRNAMNCW